jgi:hypothetical protein
MSFLRRYLPNFSVPMMAGNRWRRVVLQQPIAGLCKTRLISYVQASEWEITSKEPGEKKKYQKDIDYYTAMMDSPPYDFDTLMDMLWQDALDLPTGGNAEIVRWPKGKGPGLIGEHPTGHVHAIEFMDGATVHPTGDRKLPLVQMVEGHAPVYFEQGEIGRILMSPRPEHKLRGYGMAPPERIFLAILLLYYGDQYYARLLLDTPEAGILYLGDMDQESAEEWLGGFRELFQGINPMKIPVIAETNKPPAWIQFGRSPHDMTYNETTQKYARVVTAGYNLKTSDIGLHEGQETLAGKIRDDRAARATGYGVLITKTENWISRIILPPYLTFRFRIQDEEALIQRMRARLMAGQAAKALVEAQIATPAEIQEQLMQEGIFTVKLSPPPKGGDNGQPPGQAPPAPPQKPQDVDEGAQQANEKNKVPAEQGGRGDVPGTKKADLAIKARWPAGDTGGRGGRFAPKDTSSGGGKITAPQGDTSGSEKKALDWFTKGEKYNEDGEVDGRYVTEHNWKWTSSISDTTGIPQTHVRDCAITWLETSNDNDMRSLSLQEAASEEFGVPLSSWQKKRISSMRKENKELEVQGLFEDSHRGIFEQPMTGETIKGVPFSTPRQAERAVLRAMYNNTQAQLKEAGIEEMTLYRGVGTPDYAKVKKGEVINQVGANAMESWSMDKETADWYTYGQEGGLLLKSTVPASRILSTGRSGFGGFKVREVVTLGGSNDQSEVLGITPPEAPPTF